MTPATAFLIRSLDEGGAQRQLYELVKGLSERKIPVAVLTLYPGGLFWERFRALEGVQLVPLGKTGRWDLLRPVYRLWKWMRRTRPRAVYGYMTAGNLLALFLKTLFPGLRVVWGIRTSNVHLKNYGLFDRMMFRVECALSSRADAVIFNSNCGLESYAQEGFDTSRGFVIPNGIDTRGFRPDADQRREARRALDIGDEVILVGHVGRLDPVKDHKSFLNAAAALSARPEGASVRYLCVVAGSGEYYRALREMTAELGLGEKVHWVKDASEMAPYYNAMDIFASTSYVEGFSNVLCEAMACAKACVATDCGDNALILREAGLIVPAREPAALLEALRELLAADREALGVVARERIITRFGTGRMIDATLEVLEAP